MATGTTTTSALADSLPMIINEARLVREFTGVMPTLVDKANLKEGQGTSYNEISLAKLTAMEITETTKEENPQQISDALFSVTPTMSSISVVITDEVARRIAKVVYAKLGALSQNAIQRKKDTDGLSLFAGATTTLGGAGTVLTSGLIGAAAVRITSNVTEGAISRVYCVHHGFSLHALTNELVAPVGTYNITEGPTAQAFTDRFRRGMVLGAEVYEDGNISINSSDDARGGVFAKEAILLVQGMAPKMVMVRREDWYGGASVIYHRDQYAYGERSSGNWLYGLLTDASSPTS